MFLEKNGKGKKKEWEMSVIQQLQQKKTKAPQKITYW